MTRPTREANELSMQSHKGFQTSARRTFAARQANATVALLMASGLTLATIVAVTIVSIEVVKAAALH